MPELFREHKSIAHFINAAGNTTDLVDAYTVSAGKRFVLEQVAVHFGTASNFDLEVRVDRGLEPVRPTHGTYRAGSGTVHDRNRVVFSSGDTVLVYYKNNHITEVRKALVLITGYEE